MDSGAADRKGLTGVGYAGKGTVNRTQGIAPDYRELYLKEMIA